MGMEAKKARPTFTNGYTSRPQTVEQKLEFRYAYTASRTPSRSKRQFTSGKDFTGCNVTYLRSPSSADSMAR